MERESRDVGTSAVLLILRCIESFLGGRVLIALRCEFEWKPSVDSQLCNFMGRDDGWPCSLWLTLLGSADLVPYSRPSHIEILSLRSDLVLQELNPFRYWKQPWLKLRKIPRLQHLHLFQHPVLLLPAHCSVLLRRKSLHRSERM